MPTFGVSQVAERSDTLPPIHTISQICYKAKMKGDEIILGEREWYKWFKDDQFYIKNKNGSYKSITTYNEEGEIDRISVFKDHANGNLAKISTFKVQDKDTVLTRYTKYYYDHKDFCYLDSAFDENGEPALITKSVKDYDQNIEVNKTVYPNGDFLSCYVDYLDENGWIVHTEERGVNNNVLRDTYYFRDTINHTSEYFSIEGNDTTSHTITHYNEKGLELYDMHFTEDYSDGKQDYTFDYKYNEFGDWIKKLVFKEGELMYCVVRKITYYEH